MTVRIGVIGCGMAARRIHLPALRAAGFEVTAFASRTRSSAEVARDEWGSGEVCSDWEAVLERDDVDAVVVATPNSLHAQAAIAAARAGKHSLVEKPLASRVAEADAMIAAADEAGTVLMCAHNLRFASPFVAIAQSIERGDVGHVVAVRSAFGHGGPSGWAPDATWFYDPELSGGGALIDLGIHMADVLHFVLRDRVTEVAAALSGTGPVEDSAQLVLRFAHGAIGTLHASWVVRPGRDLGLDVFGSEGTIRFDGRGRPTLERADGGAAAQFEATELKASTPEGEERPDLYRGFLAAIETGTDPPVTARDGRNALAVVEAAYASAVAGGFSRTAGSAGGFSRTAGSAGGFSHTA